MSHTNEANLPFARNWLAHLQRAGVHNFALVATDDGALGALAPALPGRVARCPPRILDLPRGRPLRYKSSGWTQLMFAVPRILLWVLSLDLSVLWMDTDVVALSNPFPVLHAYLGNGSGAGLLGSVDGRVPATDLRECGTRYSMDAQWGHSAGGWKLCGGLFYLRRGAAAKGFVRDWQRRLRGAAAGAKNQPHFNDALRGSGLPFATLPCDLFPNGFRYASDEWRAAQRRRPILVHNNWIKGHEAKRERFERWGMWLAPAENGSRRR